MQTARTVKRDDLTGFEETWRQLEQRPGFEPDELDATLPPGPATFGLASAIDASSKPLPRIELAEGDAAARQSSGADLELRALIGEGGMGRVHRAYQRSLEREVAVKRARLDAADDEAQRLRNEALITSQLDHPSVVPVHALGVGADGRPLIVMKRAEGVTWQALLDNPNHEGWAKRQADPEQRQTWHIVVLIQLCNAVAFAHSRGVLHRDIKPDNVISGEFGEVYLMDWGLAARRSDLAGSRGAPQLVGTPVDMAPEVVAGEDVDERTDVYLLGATLHRVLTGSPRHDGATLREVMGAALQSEPFAYGEDVPRDLAQLANRATARQRDARPTTALEFRDALSKHLRNRSAIALCESADARLRRIETLLEAIDAANADGGAAGAEQGDAASAAIELRQLVSECRFAYLEVLRQWPDSEAARAGLQACLEAKLSLELRQRHLQAARAALAELPEPRAELAAAVSALEGELQAQQAEQDRLRELARDVDPSVAAHQRAIALGLTFFFVTVVFAISLVLVLGAHFNMFYSITMRAVVVAVAGGVALAWRRRLFASAFNRRFVGWCVLIAAALLVLRLVCVRQGVDTSRAYVLDLVMLTMLVGTGAIALLPRLWIVAGVTGSGLIVALIEPRWAQVAFAAATVVSMVLTVIFLSRAAAAQRALGRAGER